MNTENSTADLNKVNKIGYTNEGKFKNFELDGFKFNVGSCFYKKYKQSFYIQTGGWVQLKNPEDDLNDIMGEFKRKFKVWSYDYVPKKLSGLIDANFILRDVDWNKTSHKNKGPYSFVHIEMTMFMLEEDKFLDHLDKLEDVCESIKDMMMAHPKLSFQGSKENKKRTP